MPASNDYDVSQQIAAPRTIAAVRARVPASRVSSVFRQYLDQVYAAGKSGAVPLDGQNVFVYRDVAGAPNEVDVEFGVGVTSTFVNAGNVECIALPLGAVATTTHRGDYGALGAAHSAIVEWCRANGRHRAGPRWEVYGHWSADKVPRTDVFYLLE
jgi:effector-binding domain-containing protein